MYRFLCHRLFSAKASGAMLVCTIDGNDYKVEPYTCEIHSTEFINGIVIVGGAKLRLHSAQLQTMPEDEIPAYLEKYSLLEIADGEEPVILPLG